MSREISIRIENACNEFWSSYSSHLDTEHQVLQDQHRNRIEIMIGQLEQEKSPTTSKIRTMEIDSQIRRLKVQKTRSIKPDRSKKERLRIQLLQNLSQKYSIRCSALSNILRLNEINDDE
jgi:hypothetical protein